MGYKNSKTIERNPISGHYHHKDIETNGEFSGNELRARSDARLSALKAAIDADSSKGGKIRSGDSPALGDALSRLPKPAEEGGKEDRPMRPNPKARYSERGEN